MNPLGPSGRKRVISESDEPSHNKRSRMEPPSAISRSPSFSRLDYDRFTIPLRAGPDGDRDFVPHTRPISTSSSFTMPRTPSREGSAFIDPAGMALMRSASFSSLRSTGSSAPAYPEGSAKYCLRDSRLAIDFSLPANESGFMPLSLSRQNILYFTRGNRVQYKNLGAADEIGQLSKLQEKHGDLKLLESGGADQPGILAIATTKGVVQVWDCESKKMTGSWSTKGVGSMAWNGPVLSMGGLKGTIRYYDTRIQPSSKMKEQAPKVTRHQAPILTMSWNVDGRILASGDESGVAHCWDARQKERVPLDVGEFVSRRKKIQHDGSISALSWCPWQSKVLATGDVTGLVKIWSIEASHSGSNATTPGKLELGSKIVNLYFSPNYKELLSVLGPSSAPPDPEATGSQTWPRSILSNSVAVHSYPSLRQITNLPVSDQAIGGSVLNAGATKIVVAVPGEAKLKVFDAWGKRKEVKRQTSFLGNAIR